MESGHQCQLIYTVNDLSVLYNLDPLLKKKKCFPGGSEGKASACNAGDPGLILGLGRSHGCVGRMEWLPTQVFSPGEFHEHRSLGC